MLQIHASTGLLPSFKPRASQYRAYGLQALRTLPQLQRFSQETRFAMEVVAHVLPFKTNNYVVDELIRWDDALRDPMFTLTFPQKEMLPADAFETMAALIRSGAPRPRLKEAADKIRLGLNPHPAGQMERNVPRLNGESLTGMQHKYRETVLFFPSQGQTCHAYCSFCFRWPQFVGLRGLKFASREADRLVSYLRAHPEVTDVLFTGGDPLVMKSEVLAAYIRALIDADLPGLQTLRIGTKALTYWPYRFTTDEDADPLLRVFENVVSAGKHLALMAHVNHPVELTTPAVREAVRRIRNTGAEIRTQSPLLAHINDDPALWRTLWSEQVRLGMAPYYMFVARNTGARDFFSVPLDRAYAIYRDAQRGVSGLARTARGPSMSATPGKVHVLGVSTIRREKVFVLQLLQGRDPEWCHRPFYAQYDPEAVWLDDLKPAFGEKRFFFENDRSDSLLL